MPSTQRSVGDSDSCLLTSSHSIVAMWGCMCTLPSPTLVAAKTGSGRVGCMCVCVCDGGGAGKSGGGGAVNRKKTQQHSSSGAFKVAYEPPPPPLPCRPSTRRRLALRKRDVNVPWWPGVYVPGSPKQRCTVTDSLPPALVPSCTSMHKCRRTARTG